MRIGYLECFSGISGDMLLGALVDAGVPFATLAETAAALNVGARLEMHKVSRGGLAATKVDVLTPEPAHQHAHDEGSAEHSHDEGLAHAHGHEHGHSHSHEGRHEHTHSHDTPGAPSLAQPRVGEHESDSAHTQHHEHEHRSLSTILGVIRSASLSEAVKQRSMRAFQMLGETEAAIHSVPIESVHFHEVGAVDTIIDIVCSAAGCEALGVDRWMASPLNVGSGTVKCAHGILPVPAPATLALLGSAPVYSAGEPMERVTPTGATLLRVLDVQYGSLPAMSVKATGYGAGGRETAGQPNLLRLLVGEALEDKASARVAGTPGSASGHDLSRAANAPESTGALAPEGSDSSQAAEPIAILETVIDDTSPQLVAYVSELLLEAGAWDVYRVSVQMKKGRTGVQMTVLCRPDLVTPLRELLFRETTTIGMHWRLENKVSLSREFRKVATPWGEVSIKIARWPSGKVANASPEYEDCRKIAATHSLPLKQVMQQAMLAYAQIEESH